MFLALGTVAAALHGRLTATGVLIACAAVAGAMSFAAEPVASVLLAGIGWLTVVGFSRPPYAQLRPTGTAAVRAAVVVGASALACAGLGLVFRWYAPTAHTGEHGYLYGHAAAALPPRAPRPGGQAAPDAPPAARKATLASANDASAAAGWSRACCSPPPCCRCSPPC